MPRRRTVLLLLVAFLMVEAYIAITALGDLRHQISTYWTIHGLLWIGYAGTLWAIKQEWWEDGALKIVLPTAVLFRLVLVPAEPSLSDDIYRYMWDGRVQVSGINPYSQPPIFPDLSALKDQWHPLINNPHISTIYGPPAQILFAVVDCIWHSPQAFKAAFVLLDVTTILLLALLLKAHGRPKMWVVAYAWNPLVIVESAHSGHLDALPVMLTVLTAFLWAKRWPVAAWGALAVAAMVKPYALLLAPLLLKKKPLAGGGVFIAVSVGLLIPYLGAGERLVVGLGAYAGAWRFNDSLFAIIDAVMDSSLLNAGSLSSWAKDWLAGWGVYGDHVGDGMAAKIVVGVLLMAIVSSVAWRGKRLMFQFLAITAALLFLAPAVNPWYLTWMVPWLCFLPVPALILWTGLAPLSYHVLSGWAQTGVWSELGILRWVEYVPVFAGLVWHLALWWRSKERV